MKDVDGNFRYSGGGGGGEQQIHMLHIESNILAFRQ